MRWICLGCERVEQNRGKIPLECVCGVLDGWIRTEAQTVPAEETEQQARSLAEAEPETAEGRLSSGSAELDALLAGGWEPGSSVVLYGPAGAGKSRLAYRWASVLGPTLIVALEMNRAQTRAAAAGAGARLSRLYFWPQREGWQDQVRQRRARVVVIDSLSELGRGALAELGALKNWVRENSSVAFAITHANKRGRVLGPSAIENRCDALLRVTPLGPSSARLRIAKSRFCPRGQLELELGR